MAQRHKRKQRKKQKKNLPKGVNNAITTEDRDTYYVSVYNITSESIADMEDKIPEEITNQISELNFLVHNQPKKAIPKLLILKDKHPDTPILYNYLAKAYSQIGNFSATDEMRIENYAKNPNYLFAKINYAHMCLDAGNYGKIPEIFDNKFDLKLLYPDRDEFHISEFEGFTGMMCIYYHKIGKNDAAKLSYDSLKKVSPDSKVFAHIHKILYPGIITRLIRKLRNKKTDHEFKA